MVLSSWQAIAIVYPVHLMNADWVPNACPETKPLAWALSLPVGCYNPNPPSLIIIIIIIVN